MKNIILTLLGQLLTIASFAQTFPVQGKVTDATDSEPMSGAHVMLTNKNTKDILTEISDYEGLFRFENVQNGTYELAISFIGFQDYNKKIQIDGKALDLGLIRLGEGVNLQEVEIIEKVLPALQIGDTMQFNAEAYKTLPDASAEDLVEKMPTVVMENGKIQAQGEDVNQVLVDGKRFFGDDPTAALRNLPAEVIDKIQIFDQQSEQAQFTGFDDGETSKTINIITKTNMRTGEFGKFYVGYGYDNKYQAGGNLNIFNGEQRISIIGMTNNVNQQNFATEDLLGVVGSSGNDRFGGGGFSGGARPGGGRGGKDNGSTGASVNDFLVSQQDGIIAANAAGINFSDKWGEKIDVSASYFFNKSDNTMEQLTNQQFFDAEGINELYDEQSTTQSTNINHRFSGWLDYQIDDRNSLIWRPTLSWQGNEGTETMFGQTSLNANILSQTDNSFNSDLSALNLNSDLLWKHKFDKERRTFSVNLSTGYAPKSGDSFLLSENIFGENAPNPSLLNQYSTLDPNSWNLGANLQYTEPVGYKSMLMLNYRASYRQEESDKETFDFDGSSEEYDLFNSDLSNVFSNDYYSQQMGGGYNYRQGSLVLMARANVQWAQLLNNQTFPFTDNNERTFWNVLPMAAVRYRVSRTENFGVFYRASTQLPSIDQLQTVVDNSNPLQLTVGNSGLLQSTQHNLFTRYSKTNTEKSSVFYFLLRGGYSDNYIANSTYLSGGDYPIFADYDIEQGVQLTQPVNLDGYWNFRTFITYGFPVQPLKSNLNIDFTTNYNRTPGLINEVLNYSQNTTTGLGLTLGSNISDRIDFTISSHSNYNIASNSLHTESNTNYFNQNTRLKFNWIFGNGLVFRTDLTHQFYDGLSEDFNQNYLLWNMSIGKKIFKNQRGEISLSVFDILNQNNSLTRSITETYIEDAQTNVLQQYFMLSFKFDLRHFKIG